MPTTELTLMPPAAAPVMGSLYQILDELVELAALADDPELADDERLAVEQQIAKYVGAEIAGRKVDGIAATLRECETRAATAGEESKRLAKRAQSWLARYERIKGSTLRAMQAHGVTKLETPTNRIRIQNNGGKEPLEVYAPSELLAPLRRYSLQLGGEQWATLLRAVGALGRQERDPLVALMMSAAWEPDGEAIRAALKGRVVCPECKGILDVSAGCTLCENGSGTVPAEVAGARLLQRGVHLRVE